MRVLNIHYRVRIKNAGGIIIKRLLFLLILLSSLLAACNSSEPEIQVETIISDLTAEEFDGLGGTEEYGESTVKDYKKLTFDFSIKHDDEVERKIEMFEEWRTLLNDYDDYERYWFGESSSQDNIDENFANYHYELVFYSKGLSEENIREIFKEARINVDWKSVEEKAPREYVDTHSREYFIEKVIKFN